MVFTSDKRRGFALLITITLLAFLVLLLVSLASLTRVETQVASNGQQLNKARQNALFALNIALGQLQKHLGPDQRVSARADIVSSTLTATDTWSGSSVTPAGGTVYHNNALLTGVWGNRAVSTTSPYINTPQVLTWLVSGNESAGYTTKVAAPDYGRIDATASITAAPLSPSAAFTPTAAKPAVQLVGPGTVGSSTAARALMVGAITQPITVDSSQVPGLGSSGGPVNVGRYAYWVGDEGIKAKFNLPDAWATASTDPEKRYRYQIAQRAAIELMTTDGTTPIGVTAYDQTTAAGRDKIANAISPASVSLSLGSPDQTVIQARFHDLTTHSRSVLSNTRDGGLKKDLTAAFATGSTAATAPAGKLWSIPAATLGTSYGANMLAAINTRTYDGLGPDWQVLRSYAQLGAQVTDSGTAASMNPIAPAAATVPTQPTQMGVFPVIVGYQIFYASELIKDPASGQYQVLLKHIPAVMLWNPYNVTLKDQSYGFVHSFDGAAAVFFARIQSGAGAVASTGLSADAQASSPYYYDKLGVASPSGLSRKYPLKFELQSGDLEPGRAYVYTLPADATTSDAIAAGYPAGTFKLTRGWVPGGALGFGIVARSTPFTSPPPLPPGSNYYCTFGLGGGSTAANMPLFTENAAGSVPGSDLLIMRLGSVTGPDLQWVSNNTTQATRTVHQTLGSTFPGSPTTATTASSWGFKNNLKSTDFNAPLAANTPGNNSTFLVPWIAGYNPRATNSNRSAYETQVPGGNGYYDTNPSFAYIKATPSVGAATASSVYSINESGGFYPFPYGAATSAPTVLFDIPRPGQPLKSIASLQHADIYRAMFFTNDVYTYNRRLANNFYPAYPIGNSWADHRVGLAAPYGFYDQSTGSGVTYSNVTQNAAQRPWFFDQSFLANQALWDGYFFSTVPYDPAPATPVAFPLPNGRHVLASAAQADDPAALRDADQASARLLVDGGFNINSTSEEAWRAVLAGTLNAPVGSQVFSDQAPVPRLAHPADDTKVMTATGNAETNANSYTGYRALTADQVRALATRIVAQVKARGPFVSLADFVNRALVDNPATPADERTAGALQAALAAADVNKAFTSAGSAIETLPAPGSSGGATYAPFNTLQPAGTPLAAAAPGWVTQADLLQVLGPVLSARSDTFVVRAYGEVLNPLLASGDPDQVQGRAWAEAVVQRLPDYVSPSATDDNNGTDGDAAWANWTGNLKNSVNQTFGRRFKIISFRWLTSSDI